MISVMVCDIIDGYICGFDGYVISLMGMCDLIDGYVISLMSM